MSSLLAITTHYRAHLKHHEVQATRHLVHAHGQALHALQPHLDSLYKQIEEKQAEYEDGKIPLHWLYESNRVPSLVRTVTQQIDHFAATAQVMAASIQRQAVTLGTQAARAQLHASDVATPQDAHPSATAKLTDAMQPGSARAKLFRGFGTEAGREVKQALLLGVSLGHGVKQIGTSILGKLKTSLHRAIVVVKDAMMDAYNGMLSLFYQANNDTVVGWIWICSFSNSCAACIAMHGSEHSLDEELDDHPCGHCTQAPLLASGATDIQSGAGWLASQDAATQQEVFGSQAAYDLWASDDISLEDFVGVNNDPVWGKSIYQRSVKQLVKEG